MKSLLIVLIAASGLCGQSSSSPSSSSSRPTSRPQLKDDPAARKLFEDAAAAQIETEGDQKFAVVGFRARVTLKVNKRTKGKGRGRTNEGDVEWRYWEEVKEQPGKRRTFHWYWRHIKQPDGKEVWVRTNGRRYSLREKGHDTRTLGSAEYQEDRQQIDDELREARKLARLFILKNLPQAGTRIAFGRKKVKIATPNSDVDTSEIHWSSPDEQDMSFLVGPDKYIYQVTLHPQRADQPEEVLRFSYHEYRKPTADEKTPFKRILIPRIVEFFRDGEQRMIATANDSSSIEFNTVLNSKSFEIPPKK